MAILLDFEKVREDSQEVEYIFGYPEMDRRLVIDKTSQEGRPADGTRDRDFSAILVKILKGHQTLTRWPEKGTYAA
jgi:hypothetical protein